MVLRKRKIIKIFYKLEKTKAVQGIIKKFEIENKEISNPIDLNKKIRDFLKSYLQRLMRPTKVVGF